MALIVPPVLAAEGDVQVGQKVVFRLRAPAGGLSIQQRVDMIYSVRILPLLGSDEFFAEKMTVRTVGQDTGIFYSGKLIVVVDWASARSNNSTPAGLAPIWANNLSKAVVEFKAQPLNGGGSTL